MKVVMGTLRKEAIVGVTCWELKSPLFKALVLPTSTYGTKIWGGDLKNSYWKVFEKGLKMHMMFILSYFVGRIWRASHRNLRSQAHYGLPIMPYPPISLLDRM